MSGNSAGGAPGCSRWLRQPLTTRNGLRNGRKSTVRHCRTRDHRSSSRSCTLPSEVFLNQWNLRFSSPPPLVPLLLTGRQTSVRACLPQAEPRSLARAEGGVCSLKALVIGKKMMVNICGSPQRDDGEQCITTEPSTRA
ncbi:hypothetical protein V5799_031685 [Amblyomma americanum]|uniref:Uncharacterized protein n=1 Tax=Amblyomma americanum TaxID=6943 RepID=A0AAQ4DTB6_AMBAM